MRGEDTTFIDDLGNDSRHQWDSEVAPRVSVSYDVKGDGRSSLGALLRSSTTMRSATPRSISLALSTAASIEEQVFVDALGEWVNFRTRGGPGVQDAFFAPSIATPVTEELQLQYKQDLGNNMMFEINLIDRESSDIGEDYGLFLLRRGLGTSADTGGDPNASGSFFLGPEFFGFDSFEDYSDRSQLPISARLPDGKRFATGRVSS